MRAGRRGVFAGIVSALVSTGVAAQQQPAPAQAARLQVSLAEAVRRALDVQPAVVQARGDQRNAGASERAAVGAFLPSISIGGSSNKASSNRYNSATGQIVTVPSNTSYFGSLSASVDLFDGFRRFANQSAASASVDAADAAFANQRAQVTAATQQLFFTALAQEELVRVAEAQLQRAKEELQIAVNKFQAGAATRSDTLTATVDLGNGQLALLQANANLATGQANLGRQIGVDQLVRAVPDTTLPSLPDTMRLRAEVLDSSPQVQQAAAQVRAARSLVTVARSQYWPTLSASYSNGYTGLDAGTLHDLLAAHANMTQAEVNQVQARYNYLIARAQVEALVGHAL